MLNQDTKRKIDSARQILVGKVPDPKAQVEQITTAMIYKFMDDMDKGAQELGGKARFFTNGYEKYAWTKLMDSKVGGQDRLNLYVEAITTLSQNPHLPQLFRDIFKDAFLPYRDPETLNLFLKTINGFTYDHSEDLGDAFEYLLSILGSQGDAGQFRPPRHIIDFIVEVVDPKKNETILDPACGTAGFLISAYKHILKQNKEKALTPDEKLKLMNNLAGYDISPDMVKLALVNMYLHGFPEPKIHEYDSLTSEKRWDETFDVILANPPFMSPSGGIVPHKKFSIQSSRAEVLFVDYISEHLKIGGRAGIIIPEGIIFQSNNAYKNLRKNLIDNWGLFAIVSLPSGVFQPYAGVKTSILFLDKEFSKHTDKIIFVTVENDGFELGTQRKPIEKNDLPKVLSILHKWKNKQEVSAEKNVFNITKKQILENADYNFTVDRYREKTNRQNKKWSMITLGELESQGEIEFLRGQGVSKKDIVERGKNRCIHYGELYTLYTPIIDKVFSKTNLEGKVLSVSGDVLVPSTTTADAMGIAIARAVNVNGIILGGDINIIRTRNKKINSKFLSLLLNFPLKRDLASFAKGVNILHISNKDIKQIHIPLLPMKKQEEIIRKYDMEQEKIGEMKAKIEKSEKNIKEFIFEIL